MAVQRQLWATTSYDGAPVYIWKMLNPRWAHGHVDANTARRRGKVSKFDIRIAAEVFNAPTFDETLIHEFCHVIEWLHSVADFDPVQRGSCSAMTRTVSKALAEMLRNLKQTEVSPLAPTR